MKAIVVEKTGAPTELVYKEVEQPVINENQVLIKVKAASVNYADVKMRSGTYPGKLSLPFTPGLDCSGIVVKTGANVTHLQEGQHVIAFPAGGSYAEFAVADERMTFAIPDAVDFKNAAAFPIAAFVSYELLFRAARIQPEEFLLIHAAGGGIGTTVIQMAKNAGCKRIIAVSGNEEKTQIAKEMGADWVINHQDKDFEREAAAITGGQGVDVILDSIGGEFFHKNMQILASFGRLIYFGNASQETAKVDISELYPSGRTITGYSFGKVRKERPEMVKEIANKVIPMLAEERININISKVYPMSDADKAHEWVESRKSTGKLILVP
ncbi:quinone oxidoreductase family protein [Bacillus piscicola]|uniref:quinone oxidoreductase family protein n=1 Tax=Bacillus piscicola TaxID=1632684 RepID=UPI001F0892EA|nr:zinc-binding dehydrogenase [Bacillus piscicola]